MATEHTLKLKAVLDSQQVQQELQKLRETQNAALGGGGASGAGAPGAASNLTNLNTTISKLNATIAQLQKAITGIAKGVKAPATAVQAALGPSKSQFIPPIALPTPKAGQQTAARLGSYVQKTIDEQVKKAVLDAAQHNPSQLFQQMSGGPFGIFNGLRGSRAQQQAFNKLFNGVIPSDIVNNGQLTPQAQAYFKNYLPAQPTWLNKNMPSFFPTESKRPGRQMMQGVRFMAGSYMLGGLSQIGEGGTWAANPVSKTVGAVAEGGAGALMSGGAAAALGLGPVGIVLAAAIPLLTKLKQSLDEIEAEKIGNLASALGRANAAFEQMYDNFQSWDFSKFKDRIAGLDFGNLESERAAARTKYESEKADYDKFNEGMIKKIRKIDSDYFSGRISATEYGNRKQDLATEQDSYKEAMDKAKEKLDAINDVYEAHKKAMEDFTNVVKTAKEFDKRMNDFDAEQLINEATKGNDSGAMASLLATAQAEAADAMARMAPIRNSGGLAAYETETNTYREKLLRAEPGSAEADSLRAIIKAREEASNAYKISANDLMKAVGKSRGLEDAIKQLSERMKDFAKNIDSRKRGLAQYDENAKNVYDQKWGRFSNEALTQSAQSYWGKAGDFKKAYEKFLDEAASAKTPEEAQEALDKAEEAKAKWQFNQQQAVGFDQTVVSRLQEKLADLKSS